MGDEPVFIVARERIGAERQLIAALVLVKVGFRSFRYAVSRWMRSRADVLTIPELLPV